jgi:glyceraldehyde-3-phosphate dehydrogenase (NADP+)
MRIMPEPLTVRNPFSGQTLGQVPVGDESKIEQVLRTVHEAFDVTRREPAFRRAELLQKIATTIENQRAELASLIVAEAGKPITLAEAEVSRAIWTFTSAANEARRFQGEAIAADAFASGEGHFAVARRFPLGVVYGFTPFNFPLNLVAHKIAPAIACGNSIVIKPSPKAPLSSIRLAKIIAEEGAPEGQVQVVALPNELALKPIADPRVKFVSFTGSVPVGWMVNEAAAKSKKRATLELGGNAGVIVHDDADVAAAIAPIAAGAFGYAGQSCISVQRVFIHQKIFDDFTARFIEHVTQHIRAGDPARRDVTVGPMIDDDARNRVLAAIEAARKAGAKILTGGGIEGPCVQPTVLTGADPTLDVCAKEIFAPVVVLDRYATFDEAIAKVNDSPFGLQAGVFTRDISLALRAFRELIVGGVMINQVPTFRLENMPYGGSKDSGVGREGVRYAIEEMTELRTLVLKH